MRQIDLLKKLRQTLLFLALLAFAIPSNAQFADKKTPGVLDDDDGQDYLHCVEPGSSVVINLALSEVAADVWEVFETIGWGCDLYVGISSSQGIISYTYAGNPEDYNIETNAFVDFDDDGIFTPKIDYHLTGLYGSITSTIPTIDSKADVECIDVPEEVGFDYYNLSYSVNLYCKEGDDFIPVDPCVYEEFFHMELVDGCSLETGLDLRICCDNREFEEDLSFGKVAIDTQETMSAGFSIVGVSNYGIQYEVRGAYDETLTYTIYDIRGLEIDKGILSSNEGIQYQDIDNLSSGMYILTITDEKGKIESKKFLRM